MANSPSELAEELCVSRRTIYRDLKLLHAFGLPTRYDKVNRCYLLPPHYRGRAVEHTPDQIVLLLVATQLSPMFHAPKTRAALRKQMVDLLKQAPLYARDEASHLLRSIVLESSNVSWPREEEDSLLQIIEAIRQRQGLQVKYQSAEGQPVEETITPSRLIATSHGWCIEQVSQNNETRRLNVREILCKESDHLRF
jgi:predicted DNA-binding transcriptional regulator YafY